MAGAIEQFRAAIGPPSRSRTLELRLDYIQDELQRAGLLGWVARQKRLPALIATCRRRQGGGEFEGSIEDELHTLANAVKAGCHWCDVEIETAEQLDPKELRKRLAPAQILISAHDFRRLPIDLPGLVRRLDRCGGDAIKIAAMCHSLGAARRLLALTEGHRNVVAVPMGEDALAARILALREGSALAYVGIERTTAPGQFTIETVKDVYHLDRPFGAPLEPRNAGKAHAKQKSAADRGSIAVPSKKGIFRGPSRRTRVYGVIGDPVAHSLSPVLHNAAFAARGTNAIYLPFRVRDLRDFLDSVKPLAISGFSVTLPLKERIMRHLDECDELARAIGAVNTVVARGGRLYGYNTDYAGVLRSIEKRMKLSASRVLLIGAGGSARAAAFALARKGAKVVVWARRKAQASALAAAIGGESIKREALQTEFFDAIVNSTPVGMLHSPDGADRSPLEPGELNCKLVMDLIYRPRKTRLMHFAEQRGIEAISGVEMFLAQGVAQWEMWMGERAPEATMRRAVMEALEREEKAALPQ